MLFRSEWEINTWQPGIITLLLYANQNEVFRCFSVYRYEASFMSYIDNIANVDGNNGIIIYPNPTSDQLFINLSNYSNTTVEIFNIQGQLCHSQTLESDNTEINIAHLQNGLYLVKIKSQAKVEVRKFIKE